MRIRSGMCIVCVPLFVFGLSLSPHPALLPFSLFALLSLSQTQADTYYPISTFPLKLLSWLILFIFPIIKVCLLPSLHPHLSFQISASFIHLCFTVNVCKISISSMFQIVDLFPYLSQTPIHSLQLHLFSCSHHSGFNISLHNCMHPRPFHSNNYRILTTLGTTFMVSPSVSPL